MVWVVVIERTALRKLTNKILALVLGCVLFLGLSQALGQIGSAVASIGHTNQVGYTVDSVNVQPDGGQDIIVTPVPLLGQVDPLDPHDCGKNPNLPGCQPAPEEEPEPVPNCPAIDPKDCRPNPEA